MPRDGSAPPRAISTSAESRRPARWRSAAPSVSAMSTGSAEPSSAVRYRSALERQAQRGHRARWRAGQARARR